MEKVKAMIKAKFNKENVDCRLWYRYMLPTSKWEIILDLKKTVDEFKLGCGDKFLLEVRTNFGWPRDNIPKDEPQWEVGDKVDVFIEKTNSWKEGIIQDNLATNFKIKIENDNVIPIEKNSSIIAPYRTHTMHNIQIIMTTDVKTKLLKEFKPLVNLGNT